MAETDSNIAPAPPEQGVLLARDVDDILRGLDLLRCLNPAIFTHHVRGLALIGLPATAKSSPGHARAPEARELAEALLARYPMPDGDFDEWSAYSRRHVEGLR
jgi:hypothetical protein